MLLETARAWAKNRALWALLVVLVAVATVMATSQTGDDWRTLLAREGVTSLGEVRWIVPPEPGRWGTAVAEAVPVALDEESAQGRHDIVVFDGMLDADGGPHRVRRVGNLTRTPHADDRVLDTRGARFVASAALVDGKAVTVDLFDLSGDPRVEVDEAGAARGVGARFKLKFTNVQLVGRIGGVGRSSYRLGQPRPGLSGRLDEAYLSLQAPSIKTESGTTPNGLASVLLADGEVATIHDNSMALERQAEELVLESWTQFTVNRFRATSWFGPRRIASLEKYVFDQVDDARVAWYSVVGADTSSLQAQVAEPVEVVMPEPVKPPENAVALGPKSHWPPDRVDPPGAAWGFERVPGEGVWQPWAPKWARPRQPSGRPWPVMRTSVRVNQRKVSDHVTLVAMDMRQLELHLEAGTANPRSTTGLRGTGQVPRDPGTISRLLLGFNGGFKTSHGAYGLVLNRRLFVPVKPAMATIAFFEDGSVKMGTWPGDAPLGSYRKEHEWQIQVARVKDVPQPPKEVVSLRQNLPPLVSGSELNPGGARRWGGPVARLSHASTPRSGVCVAPPSTLVYVWGKSTSASDIGRGMLLAGCEYGMHLDMNPYHTGMSMYDVPLVGGKVPPQVVPGEGPQGTKVDIASPLMAFDEHRYAAREVKDFFYLLRRRLLAERIGPPPPGMSPWSTRGMPLVMELSPMAMLSRSDDGVILIALDGSMTASEAESRGAVRISHGPLETAAPLVRAGAWVENLPTSSNLVVRGVTKEGDTVLAGCDGCGLNRLMEVLGPVPLVEADVIGMGPLGVEGYDGDGWQTVVSAPYPEGQPTHLSFTASAVIPPLGTTGFTP